MPTFNDSILLPFLQAGNERVGFVLRDGTVVEVENVAPHPDVQAVISTDQLIAHEDTAVATWHTHPDNTCNLTLEDFDGFLAWPQWRHYIIGSDGVACYEVVDGRVMRCE